MPSQPKPLRRTKVVATLGPSVAEPATLRALLAAGVDVVRLNGSHGSHQQHRAHYQAVRAAAAALGRNVGILFDLQGPKIRLGQLPAGGVAVTKGDVITLLPSSEHQGAADSAALRLACDYAELGSDVQVGEPLLIDDGTVRFEVVRVEQTRVLARALQAGCLLSRKGINLPVSDVRLPALTDKDRVDALFAAELGADMLALSFVRRASDVESLRHHLGEHGLVLPIVSKIEKPQALAALDDILAASWGVMVARGDLGVELSYAAVPMAQKRIIRAARLAGKPVITATQMLDSMSHRPTPTRAEASDVANAVLDGTDAVMLSGETASGDFPVESVSVMGHIIDAVEGTALPPKAPEGRAAAFAAAAGELPAALPPAGEAEAVPLAIAQAGCQVAHALGAKALAVFTHSGRMALWCSQKRPAMPIVAFAGSETVARCLALAWGVCAVATGDAGFVPARLAEVDDVLMQRGLAKQGDAIVLLVGAPNNPSGTTNLMVVHRAGRADSLHTGQPKRAEAACDQPG